MEERFKKINLDVSLKVPGSFSGCVIGCVEWSGAPSFWNKNEFLANDLSACSAV